MKNLPFMDNLPYVGAALSLLIAAGILLLIALALLGAL